MGKKIVLISSVVLLLAVLIGIFSLIHTRSEQDAARSLAIENETRTLRLEETEITSEMNLLKDKFERQMYGSGTLTLLFNSPDEQLYSFMHPILAEQKYYGVIVLSEVQYPGNEGYMTMTQFKELLSAGWSYCIRWTDGIDSLLRVRKRLTAAGIEPTETVYFPSGAYDQALDSLLLENEFTVAIHHGENDLPLDIYDSGEGVWHPGAIYWRTGRRTLQNAVLEYGNIIFELSFQDDGYGYLEDSFSSMISIIGEYGDTLLVTNPEQARLYRIEKGKTKQDVQAQWDQKRNELEQRLRAIRESIYMIEEKYADN